MRKTPAALLIEMIDWEWCDNAQRRSPTDRPRRKRGACPGVSALMKIVALMSAQSPPLGWAVPFNSGKDPGEMALVDEAAGERDLSQTLLALEQ